MEPDLKKMDELPLLRMLANRMQFCADEPKGFFIIQEDHREDDACHLWNSCVDILNELDRRKSRFRKSRRP